MGKSEKWKIFIFKKQSFRNFYYDRYDFLLSLIAINLNNYELNSEKKTLDIGCGVGNLLKDLNRLFSFVTVYYWPRFFPKTFAPVIFARCIKKSGVQDTRGDMNLARAIEDKGRAYTGCRQPAEALKAK